MARRARPKVRAQAEANDVPVELGRCREVGDTPPLLSPLRSWRDMFAKAQLALADPRSQRAVAVAELVARDVPLRTPVIAREPADPQRKGSAGKQRIFDAVADAWAWRFGARPVRDRIDDLHRSRPASLELGTTS